MPGLNFGFTLKGVQEVTTKLDPDKVLKTPLRGLMAKAGRLVERQAKIDVPVDTGRLRASITHEVSSEVLPLWAKVGTSVEYASFIEFGTSRMAARPYLGSAFQKMKDRIDGLLNEARGLIEGAWRR